MRWSDGAKYEGYWSYGYPSGKGRFTYIDEELYRGLWTCLFINKDATGLQVNRNGFAWLVYKEILQKLQTEETQSASLVIDPTW
jgi:hypothetical protein